MKPAYWQSQTKDKPLFPELEWSKPENRLHAGKLLVVGGNLHGFAVPAEAFNEATRGGIGAAHVLLPDALRKLVGVVIPEADFVPSTPSGSFGKKSLNELLAAAAWADGVLVAGDLGRNSETAVLIESFLSKYSGNVTITKDAVDYITTAPKTALSREGTLLVLSLSQLQRLGSAAKYPEPIRFSMDLLHLVDWLHGFTGAHPISIIVKHLDTIFVAINGQVSTTKLEEDMPVWRVKAAAHASVWWLQHPNKVFESLTASVLA